MHLWDLKRIHQHTTLSYRLKNIVDSVPTTTKYKIITLYLQFRQSISKFILKTTGALDI